MAVRRFLLPALLAAAAVCAPSAAEATPLPCPTVDGEGFCYDVTVVADAPDPSTGDLTVSATVSVTNDCAAEGCPINKQCISIPCLPIRIAFADRTASVERTGVDLAGGTVYVLGDPV